MLDNFILKRAFSIYRVSCALSDVFWHIFTKNDIVLFFFEMPIPLFYLSLYSNRTYWYRYGSHISASGNLHAWSKCLFRLVFRHTESPFERLSIQSVFGRFSIGFRYDFIFGRHSVRSENTPKADWMPDCSSVGFRYVFRTNWKLAELAISTFGLDGKLLTSEILGHLVAWKKSPFLALSPLALPSLAHSPSGSLLRHAPLPRSLLAFSVVLRCHNFPMYCVPKRVSYHDVIAFIKNSFTFFFLLSLSAAF
jgi:hypothetical protein